MGKYPHRLLLLCLRLCFSCAALSLWLCSEHDAYSLQGVTAVPGFFAMIALFIKELSLLVSYVKNNAFPQPLSESEEAKHLKQMAGGDLNSRNMLIEHNLRLVAHIVKKFDNTGEDLEDLISIGTIGLIKAIESFSPDKGTKLATFAARCIENEILLTIVYHMNCEYSLRGKPCMVALYIDQLNSMDKREIIGFQHPLSVCRIS